MRPLLQAAQVKQRRRKRRKAACLATPLPCPPTILSGRGPCRRSCPRTPRCRQQPACVRRQQQSTRRPARVQVMTL